MIPGITAGGGTVVPVVDQSELPHRYWRMLIIGGSSNVAAISRLEFRETAGGADTAPGQTVITTGSWTDPTNVNNGNNGNFAYTWTQPTRGSSYAIGFDYGAASGNWKTIREVLLRNRSSGAAAQGVTNAVVQFSDDNATWGFAFQFCTADWSVDGTSRTFTKGAGGVLADGATRTVFDVVTPPTDAGPNAVALAANGNAATSGGRFVFDGNGDYYSNTATIKDISKLTYRATIEIDAVLASNTATLDGIICIGNNGTRWIVANRSGDLEFWENSTNSISAAGIIDNVTPRNVKVQFEGTAVRLYVDGALVGSATISGGDRPNGLYLGALPEDVSNRCLNGGFAGVRITHGLV